MDPACLSHVAVRTQHSCFCWHLHVRLTIESAAAATALPAAMVTKLVYTAIMVASWIDTATADAVAGEHRRLRSTRQGEQEVTVAAGCDQDDEILMTKLGGGSALGSFPKLISECGSRSFNLFDGLDNSTFTSCITASTGGQGEVRSVFSTNSEIRGRPLQVVVLLGVLVWCRVLEVRRNCEQSHPSMRWSGCASSERMYVMSGIVALRVYSLLSSSCVGVGVSLAAIFQFLQFGIARSCTDRTGQETAASFKFGSCWDCFFGPGLKHPRPSRTAQPR